MDFREVSTLEIAAVLHKFKSRPSGLSDLEAEKRLKIFGENIISKEESSGLKIFLRQFKNPFVYLLFVAFLISFLVGEKIDALMILMFVVINSILGFYQEYKSEQALSLLKRYLVPKVKVKREGKVKLIDANRVVPGDIVLLEPGDIIPCDLRLIEVVNFSVDESVLTGESQPVVKQVKRLLKAPRKIYGALNVCFSGSTVASGRAQGIAFATGKSTNFAEIVALSTQVERESTFEKELKKFSKFTLQVVSATLIFMIVANVAIKTSPSFIELLLFSIALAVSVVPEALPLVTTFSLSLGALSLAKKKVVVKRLSSIEDLGAIQVLATDKTGTLTENKLEVVGIMAKDKGDFLLKANLASSFESFVSGNPQSNAFDLALAKSITKEEKKKISAFKRIYEVPFDPLRRRTSVLLRDRKGNFLLLVRGSPEEVLKLTGVGRRNFLSLMRKVRSFGRQGKRVLAIAEKILSEDEVRKFLDKDSGIDIKDLEENLKFLGFVFFYDPIKPTAYEAIEKAKRLGVEVKILTGDSLEVACGVAKEVGLIGDEGGILGEDFSELSDEEKIIAVEKYRVFARVDPAQKYEIIRLLQEKYSVGFLGEGINDAPALKIADVGIVVESAADVSRDASDIVLLQKDLNVIIEGVMGGRKVFENTSKYIEATMASNFGNFFAIALVSPFLSFLPLLPLQILLLNLLSDFPMISIATDNVEEEALVLPKRYNLKNFIKFSLSFGLLSTIFDFTTFLIFLNMGEKPLHTFWFMVSVFTELVFLFSIRSKKFILRASRPSIYLLIFTLLAFLITLVLPLTSLGQVVFGFIKPDLRGLLMVAFLVILYIFSNEFLKLVWRRVEARL